jgi:hypothetical protein
MQKVCTADRRKGSEAALTILSKAVPSAGIGALLALYVGGKDAHGGTVLADTTDYTERPLPSE